MKKQYIAYAFLMMFGLSSYVECADDKPREALVPLMLPMRTGPLPQTYVIQKDPFDSAMEATASILIATVAFLELYVVWRASRGDLYEAHEFADKVYFYPADAWRALKQAAENKSVEPNQAGQSSCLCIAGMPGNGSKEFVEIMSALRDASCVEIDVRALLNWEPKKVDDFFREKAADAASRDTQTMFVFPDFDLLADYLYAQKSIKHGEVTFNAVNGGLSHLRKQANAVCVFMVRDTSRLEWYFRDVIKPRIIQLRPPNELTRLRLMHVFCNLYCGKDLSAMCSAGYIKRMVSWSYGFTVENIASLCARVSLALASEPITDATWKRAYHEELAVCEKEQKALDSELKIGFLDNLQIPRHNLNDLAYRICYASGFYKPKLTTA